MGNKGKECLTRMSKRPLGLAFLGCMCLDLGNSLSLACTEAVCFHETTGETMQQLANT